MINYSIPTAFYEAKAKLPPNSRILVTGATSGLGRCAVGYLLSLGVDCVAVGRQADKLQELHTLGVKTFLLDLATCTDDEMIQSLQGITIVWHCAALSSPWGRYDEFYHINTLASERLATLAYQTGVERFVHISTPSLYFNFSHRLDVKEADVQASDFIHSKTRPVNHYIATKYLAEQRLSKLSQTFVIPKMPIIMLRPRAIFGTHDRVLLPRILQLYHDKQGKIPLPNGGRVLMDITFADNVVYAMLQASTIPNPKAIDTYNITNQSPIRLTDLLHKLICENMNLPLSIKRAPYPVVAKLSKVLEFISTFTHKEPKLTAYSAGVLYYDMTLNTDKAKQELNYHAPFDLDTAIALTAQKLLQKPK